MDDERARRLARNEALFRTINENVDVIANTFDSRSSAASYEYICECGDASCTERVELTRAEYERVRAEDTHFVIRPGHEIPEIERVVEQRFGYVIVAKRGPAAQVAELTAP